MLPEIHIMSRAHKLRTPWDIPHGKSPSLDLVSNYRFELTNMIEKDLKTLREDGRGNFIYVLAMWMPVYAISKVLIPPDTQTDFFERTVEYRMMTSFGKKVLPC